MPLIVAMSLHACRCRDKISTGFGRVLLKDPKTAQPSKRAFRLAAARQSLQYRAEGLMPGFLSLLLIAVLLAGLPAQRSLAQELRAAESAVPDALLTEGLRVGAIEVTLDGGKSSVNIYASVIAAIEQAGGPRIPYSTVPPGRALKLMDAGGFDCVFPADIVNRPVGYPQIGSRPMNRAYVYAFSRPGDPVYRTVDSLNGRRIAARQGYNFGRAFDPVRSQFVSVQGDDHAVKRLLAGDVDVMIGYMPDMRPVLHRLPDVQLSWDPQYPLSGQSETLICRDTLQTRALIARIDPILQALEKDGTLKRILGSNWVDPVR
jgi:ABC-type amino acid transport substrate-binding protein